MRRMPIDNHKDRRARIDQKPLEEIHEHRGGDPPLRHGLHLLHGLETQSGTPAFRSPAKKVVSNKASTFGTPKYPVSFMRVMLE